MNSLLSLDASPVGALTAEKSAAYVGNDAVLAELIVHFGLRPYYRNARTTFYRVAALDRAMLQAEQDGRLVRDGKKKSAAA